MKKGDRYKIRGDKNLLKIFNSSNLFSIDNVDEARTISSGLKSDNSEIRKATIEFIEEQFTTFHTDMGCRPPESDISKVICSNILNALIENENKTIEYELICALEDWSENIAPDLDIELLIKKLPNLYPASLENALRIIYLSGHEKSSNIISEFKNHEAEFIQTVAKELTKKIDENTANNG